MEQAKVDAIMAYFLRQQGLVVKTFHGKEFICRRPVFRDRQFSAAQRVVHQRFRDANGYARSVMSDPRERARYEMAAKSKNRSVRSTILADYLSSPVVEEIDLTCFDGRPDSWIAIRATDDFEVVRVDVMISATTDETVESGAAMRSEADPNWWFYAARTGWPAGTGARVTVTASDRPGNKTTRTMNTQ